MGQDVLREDRDGLCLLTLNRPQKLNSLTVAMFADLGEHVSALADDASIGCVVLRGAGRCFSAGHDLNDIAAGEALPRPNFQAHVISALANLPQPVITAVHGHCYTGGLELALAGVVILAAETARFAVTHARWALVPVWGGSQRLQRRVGKAKAAEMMFTCDPVLGVEAAAIGLANRCYPDEVFEAEVLAFARRILANSPHSNRANKRLLNETDGLPLAAGLAHEIYAGAGRGPDMAERLAAFARRKP